MKKCREGLLNFGIKLSNADEVAHPGNLSFSQTLYGKSPRYVFMISIYFKKKQKKKKKDGRSM